MARAALKLSTRLGDVELPEEYAAVLAVAHRSYYLVDAKGILRDISESVLGLLGYSESELLHQPFEILFCPTYRELAKVVHATALEEVEELQRVWSYRKRDTTLVKIVSDHLCVTPEGRPPLVLGILRLFPIA